MCCVEAWTAGVREGTLKMWGRGPGVNSPQILTLWSPLLGGVRPMCPESRPVNLRLETPNQPCIRLWSF